MIPKRFRFILLSFACLTTAYDERMKKLSEAFQNINRPL